LTKCVIQICIVQLRNFAEWLNVVKINVVMLSVIAPTPGFIHFPEYEKMVIILPRKKINVRKRNNNKVELTFSCKGPML